MTARVKIGTPHRLFYIGEPHYRSNFFDCGQRQADQCLLCGESIKYTIQGGNALARTSHLRKHVNAGYLLRIEGSDAMYKITDAAPWR